MLFATLQFAYSDASFVRTIAGLDSSKEFWSVTFGTNVFSVLLFTIISYTIGHFLSYTSAITIEFFSNKVFRYPSKYLLNISEDAASRKTGLYEKMFVNLHCAEGWARLIAYIICFPVTVPMTLFARIKFINKYITRALDPELIDAINIKMVLYSQSINYDYVPSCICCDSHRIIMHYVNVNTPNASRKTENYVALYGFLRSMSMALSLVFIMAIISSVNTISGDASFDWTILGALILLALLPSIAYLGYLKFYRRHTLENFMAFLVTSVVPNVRNND